MFARLQTAVVRLIKCLMFSCNLLAFHKPQNYLQHKKNAVPLESNVISDQISQCRDLVSVYRSN